MIIRALLIEPNQTYVKIGCAMLTMLLANPEGRTYLTDSKFLREIAVNLEALDPVIPQISRLNRSVCGRLVRTNFSRSKL